MTTDTMDPFVPGARWHRLHAELCTALSHVDRSELRHWALETAGRFPSGLWRRASGLGQLAWSLATGAWREGGLCVDAVSHGNIAAHAASRMGAAASAIGHGAATIRAAARGYASLVGRLRTEPEETAPLLLGSFVGFLVGSGGFDGDGGLPDLDLVGGVGAHRSPVTHSFVMGARLPKR